MKYILREINIKLRVWQEDKKSKFRLENWCKEATSIFFNVLYVFS